MYSRIAIIAAGTAALMLGGCTQMTRHSNMMIFGTNTTVGVSVGTDATSTPGITIGFKRQEVVLLPLVANTVVAGELLNPCPTTASGGLPANCLLQGVGSEDGDDFRDTYSVLASFGATFGGGTDGKDVNARGAVAQYFATGLAARELARNGGASVVATSDAAGKNAMFAGSPEARDAVDAASTAPAVQARRDRITTAKATIANKVVGAGTNYPALLQSMDSAAGLGGTDFASTCATGDTADACAAKIKAPGSLILPPAILERAAAAQ